jgi:NAD(P)H-hydrate repair Nnr-like enzyme with NAD(P)H-hydrate epimerase domain
MNYLTKIQAKELDQYLFQYYSIEQLIETCGLAIACSIESLYPKHLYPNISILSGHSNN